MSVEIKQSNLSDPTEPQRPRRYVRRNSLHALYCRSGSLNKIDTLNEQLVALQSHLPLESTPTKTKQEQTDLLPLPILRQFCSGKDPALRRESGSMKIRGGGRQNNDLAQQYSKLRQQFDLRGQQIESLQCQIRRVKALTNEEQTKQRHLEQQMRLARLEVRRLDKRVYKYKKQMEQLQHERQTLVLHIQSIQKQSFGEQLLTIQSYRQQHLQSQVYKLRTYIEKTQSQRQQQLQSQLSALNDHKYNAQVLHRRTTLANDMLMKQLQDSRQCCEEMVGNMSRAVTTSAEYVEMRERYRLTLVEMREMRRQIMELERSRDGDSFSKAALEVSTSMVMMEQLQQ